MNFDYLKNYIEANKLAGLFENLIPKVDEITEQMKELQGSPQELEKYLSDLYRNKFTQPELFGIDQHLNYFIELFEEFQQTKHFLPEYAGIQDFKAQVKQVFQQQESNLASCFQHPIKHYPVCSNCHLEITEDQLKEQPEGIHLNQLTEETEQQLGGTNRQTLSIVDRKSSNVSISHNSAGRAITQTKSQKSLPESKKAGHKIRYPGFCNSCNRLLCARCASSGCAHCIIKWHPALSSRSTNILDSGERA